MAVKGKTSESVNRYSNLDKIDYSRMQTEWFTSKFITEYERNELAEIKEFLNDMV